MCGVGQKWVDKWNITGTIIRHTLENLKDCSSGWELAVKKHRCSTIKEMGKTGKLNMVTHLLLLLLLRLKIIPLPLNFVPMTCMINGKKWWHDQWKEMVAWTMKRMWLSSQLTASFSSLWVSHLWHTPQWSLPGKHHTFEPNQPQKCEWW